MSVEPNADGSPRPSAWRRCVAWLRAIEEVMETSYDDVQDRRLLALEEDVARLREAINPATPVGAAHSSAKR